MRLLVLVLMIFTNALSSVALARCSMDIKPAESKLEYLNGEKYRANVPVSLGGIPVVTGYEKIDKSAVITGCAKMSSDAAGFQRPVKFVRVSLEKNGASVAKTSTDEQGRFAFKGDIPKGDYQLSLQVQKSQVTRKITVPSSENNDVEIIVASP